MRAKSTIRSLQRGFSLITAIFLLVVLSALGAAMLTFFTAQQQSSALDIMGTRAYQAARAGIDWGAFQVLQSGTGCVASSNVTLGGTLAPFNVTVTCSSTSYTEGGSPVTVYSIKSTATYGGGAGQADYVERVIDATIAR
jgi:MSHA biogenesis protein MshP